MSRVFINDWKFIHNNTDKVMICTIFKTGRHFMFVCRHLQHIFCMYFLCNLRLFKIQWNLSWERPIPYPTILRETYPLSNHLERDLSLIQTSWERPTPYPNKMRDLPLIQPSWERPIPYPTILRETYPLSKQNERSTPYPNILRDLPLIHTSWERPTHYPNILRNILPLIQKSWETFPLSKHEVWLV